MSGRILAASDGTPGSEGALRVALELARAKGNELQVITVAEPPPVVPFAEIGRMAEVLTMPVEAREEDLRAAVRRQLEEIDPATTAEVVVRVGRAARVIAAYAIEVGADLIVAGTVPRYSVERWLRSETSIRILRLATVPVMLVPPLTRTLPTTAVVAIDFSDLSLAAAAAAARLLKPGTHLHLAHVMWNSGDWGPFTSMSEFSRTYRTGAEGRLDQIAANLRTEGAVGVDTAVLEGEAPEELLSFAGRTRADLIVAGSHGYGYFSRALLGSVSEQLLRGATSPVLIVPPATAPAELAGQGHETGEVKKELHSAVF
jgi:nucleotide-binding universal stress UspA family protein